ncbi:extracellular solute-binding protein [Leeia oryzae]|uniref:extracellular solute-binding protein n=1 Tax=Leeia oryzae TaxID=356662 RepID=UPI00047828E2|nr:extracellular solute-binding protein [Leeia oryzae]
MKKLFLTLTMLVSGSVFAAEEPVLNVFNWQDYFAPGTLEQFTKETGIKVKWDQFDSNESFQAKILTGHSGYDVVFPAAAFVQKQIQANVYYKLDKTQLPNLKNLDPKIMTLLSSMDPGNEYTVPYAQGTSLISYNPEKVKKILGNDMPSNPLDLIFDPKYAGKLSSCGISFFDSASEVYGFALSYMGKDLSSATDADIDKATEMMKKVRPYVRKFVGIPLNELSSGEFCLAMDYSGSTNGANDFAQAAKNNVKISFFYPKGKIPFTIDLMAIPRDAKHPSNALKFINFILRPDVIAKLTNFRYYSTANLAAKSLVLPRIQKNPSVFPSNDEISRFSLTKTLEPNRQRKLMSAFNAFKTSK